MNVSASANQKPFERKSSAALLSSPKTTEEEQLEFLRPTEMLPPSLAKRFDLRPTSGKRRRPTSAARTGATGTATTGSPKITGVFSDLGYKGATSTNVSYPAYTPDVSKERPSTASKSKLIGQYKRLEQLTKDFDVTKPGTKLVDATENTMEVLSCVQQLDIDVLARPAILADLGYATEESGGRSIPNSARSTATTSSRPTGMSGVTLVFDDTSEEKRYQHWHRRSPREVLDRRTQILEGNLAQKLVTHLKGEERRRHATEVRLSRPIIERQLQFSMLWMKIVSTAQPALLLGEVLRQHRASMVLKNLFAIQIVRYAKRLTWRKERQKWLAERLENMQRPTIEQLCKAIPLLQHLPFSKQAELQSELVPTCFKQGEYMSYFSLRAQTIKKSKKKQQQQQQQQQQLQNEQIGGGETATNQSSPAGSPTSPGPTLGAGGGKGKKAHRNQQLIFISKGSAMSHSVLAGGHQQQATAGSTQQAPQHHYHTSSHHTDSKMVEVFLEGHAIGLEALMGADVKRQMIVAKTDVDGWSIPLQRIHETIELSGGAVAQMLTSLATERRKEAMRLVPLSFNALRQASAILGEWSQQGLGGLVRVLTPVVLHRGEYHPLAGAYVIVRGRLEIVTKSSTSTAGSPDDRGSASSPQSGAPHHHHGPVAITSPVAPKGVRPLGIAPTPFSVSSQQSAQQQQAPESFRAGQACGLVECFLSAKISVNKSIRVAVDTDAWFVPKTDLMDLAAHENIDTLLPLFQAIYSGKGVGATSTSNTTGGPGGAVMLGANTPHHTAGYGNKTPMKAEPVRKNSACGTAVSSGTTQSSARHTPRTPTVSLPASTPRRR